jgi:beta-glucosidase
LQTALNDGSLTEADINVALGRAMRMRMRVGMFDPPQSVPYTSIGIDVVNSPAAQALAVSAAEQSVVLLANRANVLPFRSGLRIAVVGPVANETAVRVQERALLHSLLWSHLDLVHFNPV